MRWVIMVKSTVEERYDGEFSERMQKVFTDAGVPILEWFGGTGMGAWAGEFDGDPLVSDNGWEFEADQITAQRLKKEMAEVTGRPTYLDQMP